MRAVTARKKGRVARVRTSVRVLEACDETTAAVLESDKLGLSLHRHVGFAQPVDQQPFVFVLRKNECVRVGADARAHLAKQRRATW